MPLYYNFQSLYEDVERTLVNDEADSDAKGYDVTLEWRYDS